MCRFSAIEYLRRLGPSGDTGNAEATVSGTEVLIPPLALSNLQNDLLHSALSRRPSADAYLAGNTVNCAAENFVSLSRLHRLSADAGSGSSFGWWLRWFGPGKKRHFGLVVQIQIVGHQYDRSRWLRTLNFQDAADDAIIVIVGIEPRG